MITSILKIISLTIVAAVGQANHTINIDETDSKANYDINVIDDNTLYVDGYYFDANDFSIPEDQITQENIDLLSEVTIWDSETGQTFSYDKVNVKNNEVTYTFNDTDLTVDYTTFSNKSSAFRYLATGVIQAAKFNLLSISIVTIIVSLIITVILYSIRKLFIKTLLKIIDLLH